MHPHAGSQRQSPNIVSAYKPRKSKNAFPINFIKMVRILAATDGTLYLQDEKRASGSQKEIVKRPGASYSWEGGGARFGSTYTAGRGGPTSWLRGKGKMWLSGSARVSREEGCSGENLSEVTHHWRDRHKAWLGWGRASCSNLWTVKCAQHK